VIEDLDIIWAKQTK